MRVFITGVSCVGKTSIGALLASRLGCRFYDKVQQSLMTFLSNKQKLTDGDGNAGELVR